MSQGLIDLFISDLVSIKNIREELIESMTWCTKISSLLSLCQERH